MVGTSYQHEVLTGPDVTNRCGLRLDGVGLFRSYLKPEEFEQDLRPSGHVADWQERGISRRRAWSPVVESS